MATAQTISASYIEQLIEVNEQALASFKKREDELHSIGGEKIAKTGLQDEWLLIDYFIDSNEHFISTLKAMESIYSKREQAVEQAKRKAKSGLSGRVYE